MFTKIFSTSKMQVPSSVKSMKTFFFFFIAGGGARALEFWRLPPADEAAAEEGLAFSSEAFAQTPGAYFGFSPSPGLHLAQGFLTQGGFLGVDIVHWEDVGIVGLGLGAAAIVGLGLGAAAIWGLGHTSASLGVEVRRVCHIARQDKGQVTSQICRFNRNGCGVAARRGVCTQKPATQEKSGRYLGCIKKECDVK
jgi:hypothetical protein